MQGVLKYLQAVIEIKRKARIIYLLIFLVILLSEVMIALFIKDDFIRPYVGDILVTVLLCAFLRIFFPFRFTALPGIAFLFSLAVEIGQYFDIVRIFGFEDNRVISTLIGRTFSLTDIICYALGCVIFAVVDTSVKRKRE